MWLSILLLLVALVPGLPGQDAVDITNDPLAISGRNSSRATGSSGAGNKVEWIQVEGEVEIDRLKALESAEQKAREALWERFSPVWKGQAGLFVPEERITQDLQAWIGRSFERLAPVQAAPVQVFSSSVGQAYRKSYRIQVAGAQAEAFRRAGEARATALSNRFHKSFLLIGALMAFLLWGASRMDRLTRGYLTWRIRFVSLVLVGMGIFLIYPHA